jgi:hypothetical protein
VRHRLLPLTNTSVNFPTNQERSAVADAKSKTVTTHRTRRLAPQLGALLLCATAATAVAAPGDLATDFSINDQDPVASIPPMEQRNANPLEFGYWLQDMVLRAETAIKEKNWDRAVKYYEALARAVPERAVSFSRLCLAYGELGKAEIAAGNCAKAIQLGGATVIDHFRFMNFTLGKAQLSPRDIGDIDASLAHVREHAPQAKLELSVAPVSPSPDEDVEKVKQNLLKLRAKAAGEKTGAPLPKAGAPDASAEGPVNLPLEIEMMACRVAARLEDGKRLAACITGLKTVHASDALTLPFEWSAAVVAKNQARATQLVERAKTLGFPEASIQTMRDKQAQMFAPKGILGHLKRWGFAWLGGVLALGLALMGARRWSLSTAKQRKLPAPSA